MDSEKQFSVTTDISGGGERSVVDVIHSDESFQLLSEGKELGTIINNGDNTWQIVKGDISQETANVIGQEIENHYNNEKLPGGYKG